MDLGELHHLGRRLRELAYEAMRDGVPSPLTRAQRAIQLDVREHPGTSVGEIAARTGFSQGHVSSSVAALRDLGRVHTATDPTERRRTLVSLTEENSARIARIRARDVTDLMTSLYSDIGADEAARVVAVLEDLHARLGATAGTATGTNGQERN